MNIKKLNKIEKNLNMSITAIIEFRDSLDKYKKIQSNVNEVSHYYGSKEWYAALDEYEKGKLKGIKAGILSEDSAYNMLNDNKELAIEMIEIALKILKEN